MKKRELENLIRGPHVYTARICRLVDIEQKPPNGCLCLFGCINPIAQRSILSTVKLAILRYLEEKK